MRFRINVNHADIQNGIPGDGDRCALALAIKRKLNTGRGVRVECTMVSIQDVQYFMSKKMRKFAYDFDLRREVKPGIFYMTKAQQFYFTEV